MSAISVIPGVYYVGAIHRSRRIFDALIPTPEGTSYNSYLVVGKDKTVLIDTVEPEFEEILFRNIKSAGIEKIDFVISNHAEQDHSGTIPEVLKRFPEAKLVTNQKCKDLLISLMPEVCEDRVQVVKDLDVLNLGGRTLRFHITPWIHWPETMMTFLVEDSVLFPCDLFGTHLAPTDIMDDSGSQNIEQMKRYYAQIMMPYRSQSAKHYQLAKSLNPRMICPSHGPIHTRPEQTFALYEDWTSDNVKNEVLLPYVSTHGATARMAQYLIERLCAKKIAVKAYDLAVADLGMIAADMLDAATIAIGTGCVLVGPHPLAGYAAMLTNALRPKAKFATVFGSFGWGAKQKVPEVILSLLPNLKLEVLPPVMCKGAALSGTLQELDSLADIIANKHKSLGI